MNKEKVIVDEVSRILEEACIEDEHQRKYIKDSLVKALSERIIVIMASADVSNEFCKLQREGEVDNQVAIELAKKIGSNVEKILCENTKSVLKKEESETKTKYTMSLALFGG